MLRRPTVAEFPTTDLEISMKRTVLTGLTAAALLSSATAAQAIT
ncbi:hypothetical protein [Ornithinimicrobium flavum]|nr:hypothetical protein [Ornithinimicrobium flavum]